MITFLESICKAEDIHLDPHHGIERIRGVAMCVDGTKVITYCPTLTGWEKISVIAHEIGHHALGHLHDKAHLFGRSLDEKSKAVRSRNELEAQVFAAAFTAMAMFTEYRLKFEGGVTCDQP